MSKELICPHCKKSLLPTTIEHDANQNVICGYCQGIVFATVREAESKVKQVVNASGWQKTPLPIRTNNSSPTATPQQGVYGCDYD
jgi:hypothetical protein